MSQECSIESLIGIHGYSSAQILGTGGCIKQRQEDFIVREIPPSGKPIFDGSEIGHSLGGMYVHCVLWKKGLDTFSAIRKLCKSWGVTEEDFGYAGLKDAAAETYQRISVWNVDEKVIQETDLPNIKVYHPIRQKFAVKIGDLIGNFFEIKIHDIRNEWNEENWKHLKSHFESDGILNFYGSQRFGSKRPILHLIGKYLLQQNYSDAIDKYIGETSPLEKEYITDLRLEYSNTHSYGNLKLKFPNSYRIEKLLLRGLERNLSAKNTVLALPKSFLRLAISAYQSYLFNKVLSVLNENYFPLTTDLVVPLAGYQSIREQTSFEAWDELTALLNKDMIDFQSFKHKEQKLRSKGTLRKAIVIPGEFNHHQVDNEKRVDVVTFSLPKGSYGTVLMREVTKTET
jgi:tRNA pseudouridine13 synthase